MEEHNHEANQNLVKFLPRQRQLSGEEKAEVEMMMKVNANKKMVQQHMIEKTGKQIILKDLHNIQTNMKKRKLADVNSQLELVNQTLTSKGGLVEYVTVDNELKALFYQDPSMRRTFNAFPEVILVDATYKTNNLRMPLYMIISIDGNGQSEIVAVFLLTEEDETSLTQVIDIFKKNNPSWENVRVILTDKDMIERNVLSKAMPQANLQLCLFHVLRSFRREITPEKLGISISQKTRALELLQKIAYCKSLEEYNVLYERLCEDFPDSIKSYYIKNWHSIKTEWVEGLKKGVNLGNRTNNRIESINDKIKSVVTHHSTLHEFSEKLIIAINSLRVERDHRIADMFQKKPVSTLQPDSAEYKYQQLLTPYAYEYVLKQLSQRSRVCLYESEEDNELIWKCVTSEGSVVVKLNSCSCSFYRCMVLPCRHILKLREIRQEELYSSEGISGRWKMEWFTKSRRLFSNVSTDRGFSSVVSSPRQKKILSQAEKYRQTHRITQEIASCASEETGDRFTERMNSLKSLLNIWKGGKRAVVVEVIETESDQPEKETVNIAPTLANQNNIHVQEDVLSMETDADDAVDAVPHEHVPERDIFYQEEQILNSNTNISNIILPPVMKKRGRPKGNTQTVVGLPKKRLRSQKSIPFKNKGASEIDIMILEWFVGRDLAIKAVKEKVLITEEHVEVKPEFVSSSCLESCVDIDQVKGYCTEDGWESIQNVFQQKIENPIYICKLCKEDADKLDKSIMCMQFLPRMATFFMC